MKTNKLKQNLFSERMHHYIDQEDYDQIQMANFKTINDNKKYIKLQDENEQANRHMLVKNNIKNKENTKNIFAKQPIIPNESYNFEPNKIVINGLIFVHKDAIQGIIKSQKKPKKPQMQVMCQRCCSAQMVPANTHAFVCFNCILTQGCTPQYGIFICGHCQKQVWYPFGRSEFIKCTKCGTINKVPQQQVQDIQINQMRNPYQKENQQIISHHENTEFDEIITQKFFSKNYPQL